MPKNGKDAFMTALMETIDMLSIDWKQIDPNNIYPAPEDPVAENEKIVGELTDNQKILWTVYSQAVDKLQSLENGTPAVGKQRTEIELLKNIFFISVQHSFNVYKKYSGIAIRPEYNVATTIREQSPLDPCVNPLSAILGLHLGCRM